jgi:hypothetical protein
VNVGFDRAECVVRLLEASGVGADSVSIGCDDKFERISYLTLSLRHDVLPLKHRD